MYATLRKLSGLTLLAALGCIPAHAQQQSSQSGSNDAVAEAAKKAREQKKEAPKPKKVYTDDDISTKKSDISIVGPASAPADGTAASGQTNSSVKATDPNAAATEKEDPNSEKAWRARFATLRTKIATAEQELDVLQREENKNSVQYYADPTKAMKEQYSREEINKRAAKIEAKKKQIADLKQQWSDMEDALRAAHGDPGWSRE